VERILSLARREDLEQRELRPRPHCSVDLVEHVAKHARVLHQLPAHADPLRALAGKHHHDLEVVAHLPPEDHPGHLATLRCGVELLDQLGLAAERKPPALRVVRPLLAGRKAEVG